ncbi:hypothetical protein KKE68_03380 [Patescibacteria group bacterium]|nr:hypothetical protein [Patescibacteria group bacterium]
MDLKKRRRTEGPEAVLVDSFLSSFEDMFREKHLKFSVFVEPYIDIGFPDIIGVLWDEKSTKVWSKERMLINSKDIRILNHLSLQDKLKSNLEIHRELGYSEKELDRSITRLYNAGLITSTRNKYKACHLNKVFAPRRIIAIEAKMNDWKGAFRQARINKWFASESYVLFPGETARKDILEYSKLSKIGVIAKEMNHFIHLSRSEKINIPTSYGSWLINEWLIKSLYYQ